jgi:hypothetical protein
MSEFGFSGDEPAREPERKFTMTVDDFLRNPGVVQFGPGGLAELPGIPESAWELTRAHHRRYHGAREAAARAVSNFTALRARIGENGLAPAERAALLNAATEARDSIDAVLVVVDQVPDVLARFGSDPGWTIPPESRTVFVKSMKAEFGDWSATQWREHRATLNEKCRIWRRELRSGLPVVGSLAVDDPSQASPPPLRIREGDKVRFTIVQPDEHGTGGIAFSTPYEERVVPWSVMHTVPGTPALGVDVTSAESDLIHSHRIRVDRAHEAAQHADGYLRALQRKPAGGGDVLTQSQRVELLHAVRDARDTVKAMVDLLDLVPGVLRQFRDAPSCTPSRASREVSVESAEKEFADYQPQEWRGRLAALDAQCTQLHGELERWLPAMRKLRTRIRRTLSLLCEESQDEMCLRLVLGDVASMRPGLQDFPALADAFRAAERDLAPELAALAEARARIDDDWLEVSLPGVDDLTGWQEIRTTLVAYVEAVNNLHVEHWRDVFVAAIDHALETPAVATVSPDGVAHTGRDAPGWLAPLIDEWRDRLSWVADPRLDDLDVDSVLADLDALILLIPASVDATTS